MSFAHREHAPPTFLPFRRTQPPDELPEELTLRDFYLRYVLPEIQHEAPSSLKEDRTALNHWEALTQDPDIRAVTRYHLERLRDGMQAHGASPATINKTWRELKMIFEVAADLEIISRAPKIGLRMKSRLVKQPHKLQRETIDFEEITRLWKACRRATYPPKRQFHPAKLYRVALVLFYLYGPRTVDLLERMEWDNVRFRDKVIQFNALKTSKLQGLPLTDLAIEHLQSIMGRSRRLFPGFNTKGCWLKKPQRWKPGYYATWNGEILPEANVNPPITFKHFREAMVTRHNRTKPGLGSWIAGHWIPGVSAQSYDLPTDDIRQAIAETPVPDCFQSVG